MEGIQKQRRQRQTRPLFVIGHEGATEWSYVESVLHHYNMICKSAGKSDNRPDTLLAITAASAAKERRKAPGQLVIPVVVLDIELMSDENIDNMRTFVSAAQAKNVLAVINRPKIEHWFLQHFQPASENMSSTEVDRQLARHLQSQNLPAYTKPGSLAFLAALAEASNSAVAHCEAAGHSSYGLPCMCQLIELAKRYA